MSSGFIHDRMITQPNAFMFVYGIYLIGIDLNVDRKILEKHFNFSLCQRYQEDI